MAGRKTLALSLLSLALWAELAAAQPNPPVAPTAKSAPRTAGGGVSRRTVLSVFRPDNPMLWPLAICSVVTLGFSLERVIALRRGRVVPRDFVARFVERLASGKLDRERASELCKANDSPVARIFGHAVRYWGQPGANVRQAVDHDAEGELLDLRRNCRVLNGTATLAPLLGLLGTVVGMIEAFESLGSPQNVGAGGKGGALAHGISLALVTTGLGLAIAIVSVTMYYALLHKVDVLAKELDDAARQVVDLVSADSPRTVSDRRVGPSAIEAGRSARSEAL